MMILKVYYMTSKVAKYFIFVPNLSSIMRSTTYGDFFSFITFESRVKQHYTIYYNSRILCVFSSLSLAMSLHTMRKSSLFFFLLFKQLLLDFLSQRNSFVNMIVNEGLKQSNRKNKKKRKKIHTVELI